MSLSAQTGYTVP